MFIRLGRQTLAPQLRLQAADGGSNSNGRGRSKSREEAGAWVAVGALGSTRWSAAKTQLGTSEICDPSCTCSDAYCRRDRVVEDVATAGQHWWHNKWLRMRLRQLLRSRAGDTARQRAKREQGVVGADGSSMTSGEGDVDGTGDRRADVGCALYEDGEKMQQGDSDRRGMAAQPRSLTAMAKCVKMAARLQDLGEKVTTEIDSGITTKTLRIITLRPINRKH
ncbi:hypothetical protein BHM03_00001134 [Ensete ventricosum]|nr:hypothetical protein BHM03_00001134 [Ensete ventricosum]